MARLWENFYGLFFANEDSSKYERISGTNLSDDETFDHSGMQVSTSCFDLVCVFVVAFDTRAGNLIEWSIPDGIELEGIEFKAMTSGSHNIKKDMVYFRKGKLFGLSCFKNIRVDSEIERGVRMKSVGILAATPNNINMYQLFLKAQISCLIEKPGDYDGLVRFYDEYKGTSSSIPHFPSALSIGPTNQFTFYLHDIYSQFVNELNEKVFLLWKSILLRKRILFFSQAPVQIACQKVYCANCISFNSIPELSSKPNPNIFFYINVADIELVESTDFYIACTTDKILETKHRFSDVHVTNSVVSVRDEDLNQILTVTPFDRTRLNTLKSKLMESTYNLSATPNEHTVFTKFFTKLNNQLFRGLLEASNTLEKILSNESIMSLGLDPNRDRNFLLKLIDTYNLNVKLEKEPCCPLWDWSQPSCNIL